ncbi:response regulator transcription factor [Streptomyces sp. 549]|uniref:response regulator transcription factor n=1 Tax=Streptomyces sp. 549 TaxID=3049076 RepID=UPI0024C25923|nr:response regulator transcription factor [Streptomyces sp. 549]MDK1474914.1 response regulator transcription factor [Streptomyces sp. 549]
MTRVLVVHEAVLFRSALVALLRAEPGFLVTSVGRRGLADRIRCDRPDVYTVDVDSPGSVALLEALELARGGLGQEGALLVLANADRPGTLRKAFDAGALGFVDRNAPAGTLAEAIRTVRRGERFVDESLAFGFLQAAEMPLTPRELTVLSLAAEGRSVADIAQSLCLSRGTVRNYMAAATRKVGARNRMDAIRISQGAGWM